MVFFSRLSRICLILLVIIGIGLRLGLNLWMICNDLKLKFLVRLKLLLVIFIVCLSSVGSL